MSGEVDQRFAPHNLEAEQALLGALLVNNPSYAKVEAFLLPQHFADPVHARIFEAIGLAISRGQIADPLTLTQYFERAGEIDSIGAGTAYGAGYLGQLAASVVTIVNAHDYGRVIHDAWLRRQLVAIGTEAVNDAHDYTLDSDGAAQIEAVQKRLLEIQTKTGQPSVTMAEAVQRALVQAEKAFQRKGIIGVSTGMAALDYVIGALRDSDLIIIAGRPSMGKTALATTIAVNAARAGHPVFFASLEMSSEQLAARVMSAEVDISSVPIARGEITGDDFARMVDAAPVLGRLPIEIDENPALTVSQLRLAVRRWHARRTRMPGVKSELGVIVVDYLQLMNWDGGRHGRPENRVQEVTEISKGLKAIAKEFKMPVVALSQLSRQVESREDKRPMLSDLRESGSIEQDADLVLFCYREAYYLERAEPEKRNTESDDAFATRHRHWADRMLTMRDLAEVICPKNRHGAVGTARLKFKRKTTWFSDIRDGAELGDTRGEDAYGSEG